MKVIGLTGGIASGKSVISDILARKGAQIINADEIGKQIVSKGQPAWHSIRERFGDQYLTPDGEIDRNKLGELIFRDSCARADLNAITHPLIREKIQERIMKLKNQNEAGLIVVEAALLIEAGWIDMVDEVCLVVTDTELQIKRLMKRNGLSREQALDRIKSQIDQEHKRKYAHRIIDNSYDINSTLEQIENIWTDLFTGGG